MLKRTLDIGTLGIVEEKRENKLYIGNIDHRVTEYQVINMFSRFGKIVFEEYVLHTHGPKRGQPRGFAFIEFSTKQEASEAKHNMNGRMAFGRPLVVRFVEEKVATLAEATSCTGERLATSNVSVVLHSPATRSAKIAAIQNKLKTMEEEEYKKIELGPRKLPKYSK